MNKIVICGGHLTPALALIEELINEKNIKLIFFGRKYATEGSKNISGEYREINSFNIKFVSITAGRLSRKLTRHALVAYLKIPLGFIQSFFYLLLFRPKLIVSFGGYISLPVVFCGWLLGIDSISHEQASVPGLANKINYLFCQKMYLTWPQSQKYFPEEKTEVIGNLTRSVIFKKTAKSPEITAFIKKNPGYIVVTGGNQGSHFLNNLIFKNPSLLKKFPVFHTIGTANYRNDHANAQKIKNQNYYSCEFVSSRDIGSVLNNALFAICRSGANTVWELASISKPAILIPLPHSASGEQQSNAQILKEAGSGIVINQKDAEWKNFLETVENLEANLKNYQEKADKFAKLIPAKASRVIKKTILSLV